MLFFLRVWDEADYVVPPAENGAFFITTNLNITPNQTQVKRFYLKRKLLQPRFKCKKNVKFMRSCL